MSRSEDSPPGPLWYDDEAGPMIRPYTLTGGRTVPTAMELDLITLVITEESVRPAPDIDEEHLDLLLRCRARPLFSQLGRSLFMLDALVERCDDPAVPRGLPFSLRLIRPTRTSEYLFSRVRASVERGHALLVEVEDHLITRKARLCANGWTVVLDLDYASGWPSGGF